MVGISDVSTLAATASAYSYSQTQKQNRSQEIREQYRRMKLQKAKQKAKKKKLHYNSREISSQILRAGSAAGASQVLVRAKGKVAAVKRCAATGKYDANEIRAALMHANRMVMCAQKKVRHMRKEEQIRHKGKTSTAARSVSHREREYLRMELSQLKKKNRNEEATDIRRADLQYIKQKLRQQEREARQQYQEMIFDDMMADMAAQVQQGEQPESVDMGTAAAAVSSVSVDVVL